MRFSQRLDRIPPYLFLEISRKIAQRRAQGADVVSFGIGDPDIPTPEHVIQRLIQAAGEPANHRYPESDGLPELRRAIAAWYQHRFGLSLDPDKEVLPLIGAKEGIGHAALCFMEPGRYALVPDPGYPVYSMGTLLAGGESYYLPLKEESGWLPDLDAVPAEVARRASVLWLNYPNNPTGAVADLEYFERVVYFARKHGVAVCHDAAYSEVTFDGYRAPSFLQARGATDVGVEFHSLSKCYNMTGWRVGMVVGNRRVIDALLKVKSNLDSGIPQAIQHMAIEALTGPQDVIQRNNAIYQRRRDRLVPVLRALGLGVEAPPAGLYLWARLPRGWTSAAFAALLLDEKDIVVTPGRGYGPNGEGYVRLSLTTPDDRVDKGMSRLRGWHIPPPP